MAFSDAVVDGSCAQEKEITRTWTATDAAGNTADCVQLVSVVDSATPSISCPDNTTVQCTGEIANSANGSCIPNLVASVQATSPANTGSASAADVCDPDPAISFSDSGNDACPEAITRTWTATDACGNSTDCQQTITVDDDIAPTITCPADTSVECMPGVGDLLSQSCLGQISSIVGSTDSSITGTATATDNCSDVTITSASTVAAGLCPQEKQITRTWTATDACGNINSCNQVISVIDNTAPIITCPANTTLECLDTAGAADCIGMNILAAIATDSSNTGVASASDNCDPAPVISQSDSTADGSCDQEMILTRTWTATDACGNASTCDQTITTTDSNAPSITCPADVSLETGNSTSPTNTGTATAADACDSSPTVTHSDTLTGTDITRTWTATDSCGNSANCPQNIEITDSEDPVISCPSDATVECGDSTDPAATGSATATDNVGVTSTTHSDTSVSGCGNSSVITRTWTVSDAEGNTAANGNFTVTRVDDDNFTLDDTTGDGDWTDLTGEWVETEEVYSGFPVDGQHMAGHGRRRLCGYKAGPAGRAPIADRGIDLEP